jgi:tRNA1(Val) A37 N6-methylase TrmN6
VVEAGMRERLTEEMMVPMNETGRGVVMEAWRAERERLEAEMGERITLDALTGPVGGGVEGLRDDAGRAAGWLIAQRKGGHRHSIDDVLTAWYALENSPRVGEHLDLGTGIGTVGLLTLWGMGEGARLACVEAQAVSWRLLQANIGVNGLGGRVESRQGDLRETEFGRKFPLITGSPPYFPAGSGVLPVDAQKAHARFELRGDVRDYAVAAARQLEIGGWFVLCFPTPQKARALEGIAAAGLRTVRRRDVIPRESLGALFTLFACRHAADGEGEREEEEVPLTVRERSGRLTAEMAAVRRGFGFADGPAHGGHGQEVQSTAL